MEQPIAGEDHIDYEQKAPHHEPEDVYWNRHHERLDRALKSIEEIEQRIARNLGQGMRPNKKNPG
jgi:hypothetical protein